jgi:DNA primase
MKHEHSPRALLEKATAAYQESIDTAGAYLSARGISREAALQVRLGVVENPEVGHEQYKGRLAIPYITKTGVVDIRFRALEPNVEPKYMGMTGAVTKLYNVKDIDIADDWIAVCEGELDTLTLSKCVGVPCVGVPGANSWKPHYTRLLQDFERVFIFADGDQPGLDFAKSLSKDLPITIVALPDGEDVNSCFVKFGKDYLLEKAGLNA